MTLGGTNKWQGKYDVVNHPDTTNLLWYFEATGAFTNNFRTFPGKVYWQNTNRDRIQNGTLPYGDNCGMTDGSVTNRTADWFGVNVTPGESSYVLFTLDTAKTNYLAGRGEYQNFNAWNTGAAAQNAFTDADDKYPKTSYSQNFSLGWQASYFTGLSNWFLTSTAYTPAETAAIRLGPENILNEVAWSAGSFQYVVERTVGNTKPDYSGTASQRRNQAVRLFGGNQPLGLGYYQGNLSQQNGINGIGTITYKARLSRPIVSDPDYNYNVAYRFTDMVRSNYMMTATGFRASQVSPEQPSISLIGYYQNARRFYEYRLTQVPDSRDLGTGTGINTGRDKRVRHEIWKWNGSNTPTRIAYFESTTGTWPDPTAAYDAFITETFDLEFRIYSDASATSLAVKFKNSVEIPFVNESGATLNGTVVVDGASPIRFGSYGFHSADCTIIFPTMTLKSTGANASPGIGTPEPVIGSSSSGQVNEWYWPTELYSLSGGNTFAPATPAQSTTVNMLTGASELGPWTPFASQTVSSYAYQTYTAQTNAWADLCARIQAGNTAGVVVDGIHVGSWRGETFTASPSDGWKITEGWLNYVAPDWIAHLDASQADPELIQGVRSERILGLGSISFKYRATAVPAQLKIQYTSGAFPQDDTELGWVDVTNINIAATGSWIDSNIYLAMAPATNLYVRIINNIVSNRKATVDLRNIVIWNNPTNSPNDWAAYNMKISDTETDKWWLDKKTVTGGLDVARSGYMNNSQTANIIPGRPMTQFNPYIMAPRLTRGLGTIAFLARAFTTAYAAGETNTSISVYTTTADWDKNKPDVFWDKQYTFTNITNSFFRPFFYSHPTVPNDIKAVKLVVEGVVPLVGTPQRVCIDEIVVTDAIYPRFDITGVKLLLPGSPDPILTKQPLEGEDIGIQAQLTNVLLEPADIQVYVTYVLGTNTWGVFSAPLEKQITRPLTLVDPAERIYRTTGDFMNTGFPGQEKYNVVQYIVWAEYFGNGFHKIYQSTNTAGAFTNPSWYFPVDLNKQNHKVTGASKASWTPYYITYDVPPGSVWINEINLNENSAAIGPKVFLNPYIEIAQPAWMDLTGWNVEILNSDYTPRLWCGINSSGPIQPALGANGYGLFVIGPSEEASYPPLSTTTTVHQTIQNIKGVSTTSLYPGGYRLIRPMGMFEHAIAYDWDRSAVPSPTGEMFVSNEPAPQTPFKYVGREHHNGSLAYTGTVYVAAGQYIRTDSQNTWQPGLLTFNWTPGKMNIGQTLPSAPMPFLNGTTNTFFISPSTKTAGYFGGVYTLNISSTTNWSILTSDTWITPLITAGRDTLTLQYRIDPNPDRSIRSGFLSIICGDTTKVLQITQEAQYDSNKILGTSNLVWRIGGDAIWFEQTNIVKTGDSALQSGGITHNQQTWIETTVQGPAVLSFWWKVSSEAAHDVLTCALNNTNVLAITGTAFGNWKQETLHLECETNTIRWAYSKNSAISSGLDAGWLDDLQCVPAMSTSVLLDPQLGTLATTNELSFIIGLQYGALPFPTRAGYLFDGWYTEAEGGGTRIDERSIVLESVQTLFARWSIPTDGDIIGFYSPSANSSFTTPGATVEFTIRLYGTIVLSNLNNTTYLPEMRMEVGSDGSSSTAYATLIRSEWTIAPFNLLNRTDLTFSYTVRPGDMADPIKIFRDPTSIFEITPNGWSIFKAISPVSWSNVTWKVNNNLYNQPGDNGLDFGVIAQGDVDLSAQNILLRTLSFDDANSPATIVALQPATTWRISSGTMNSVPMKVMIWTPHTNVLQIGSVPGQALEVTIPAGSDYADFPIQGIGSNSLPISATVYAQRPSDYARNAMTTTNFISRSVILSSASSVLFDPQGGTVIPNSKTVFCGLAYGELPTPTLSGYTFDGWYTATNSEGLKITSSSIVSEADHTLFARWTINHYPISYGNTKGLSNSNPSSYTITNSFPFVPLGETSGYEFAAWSSSGIMLGTTGSVSVTASWMLKTFSISYLNEKGAINTNPLTYTTEDSFVFTPLSDLDGFTFTNWSLSSITNGMIGNKTVTANWTSRSFVVTFDPQGGIVTPSTKSVLYQDSYAPLPTPTFADAIFSGWWTEENGNGTNIELSAIFATTSNQTLYAKWDINSVVGTTGLVWRTGDNAFWFPQSTVTNHGSLAMQSGHITDNENSWIETTFTGPCVLRFRWKVDSEDACDLLSVSIGGEVKDVVSGKDGSWTTKELVVPAGEHVVRWDYTKDSSEAVGTDCGWLDQVEFVRTSVFFDAQGGSVNPTNKFVLYGTSYGELPVATFANATMDGWWTMPNGKGVQATASTVVGTYDNFTLYAKWNINSVLGTSNWAWSTDGSGGIFWFPESSIRHADKPLAMQAGSVSHSESTWIETTITNAGALSFRWAVSAEVNKDILICTTNGGHFKTLTSKTISWIQESITVAYAPLTIRWTFSKDSSTNIGTNSAWIADFIWTPANSLSGFALWTSNLGLSGNQPELFMQDRNLDGVANGFEYAFATNLPLSSLLLNIRFINGKAIVEIPQQDAATLPYVDVRVRGSTNLLDWTLPMIPAVDTTGKPSYKSWHEPDGTHPSKAFFKLEAQLK
jgi:uncharacterized repeat protein (TIGR02543 family)